MCSEAERSAPQGLGIPDPRPVQFVRGCHRRRPQGRCLAAVQWPLRDEPRPIVGEITLDTSERSFLWVKIKEVDEDDKIFTKLMGAVEESRRKLIFNLRMF